MQRESLINRRYRIERTLGEGGMGTVYLVHDLHRGEREIALKILRRDAVDPLALERFKNEFRSLTRLRHPNLVEVYDFGSVDGDGRHFLTMEHVVGQDIRAARRQAVEQFEVVAVQCLRALDYIHARGWLHNDIKPQNILVGAETRIKVLDFGLARPQADPSAGSLSGTIHYTAPERLLGRTPGTVSDLYSLGVVLYEVLAGALPYDGTGVEALIAAITEGRVRPLGEVTPDVPAHIERFTMALLALEPAGRPVSAAEALEILNHGAKSSRSLDTPETLASYVTTGRFVGRESELVELVGLATAHTADPTAGGDRPQVVLVVGESGIGKSRLIREVKHRLQLSDIRTLDGRCYEDGGVPFQPFVEVLSQLPREIYLPDPARRALDRVLPGGDARRPGRVDPADTRRDVIDQETLLSGLASAFGLLAGGTPGVLFFEDLHWADASTIDFLRYLASSRATGPWLVVATLRDQIPETEPARRLLDVDAAECGMRRIDLRPLRGEEIADLLTSMVPFEERPERLARALGERSGGNPLYVEELIKSLAEDGVLRRGPRAWSAGDATPETLALSQSLAAILLRRLSSLPGAGRGLIEALAVINRPVPLDLLAASVGVDPKGITSLLDAAIQVHLVTLETDREGRSICALVHSRVRDVIYEQLDPDRRRALHMEAGAAIEAAAGASADEFVEELAHHFRLAGERGRAADCAERAARKAARLENSDREARFLEWALEAIAPEEEERRVRILRDLVSALAYRVGEYDKAIRYARIYREATRDWGEPAHQAHSLRGEAWARSFLGDITGAIEMTESALEVARSSGEPAVIGDCLSSLGSLHARQSRFREALVYIEEGRKILEAADLSGAIAALTNESTCYLLTGRAERARELQERAIEKARASGQMWHVHRVQGNLAVSLYEMGDLAAAISTIEEAVAWAKVHGASESLWRMLGHVGILNAQRGRFDLAIKAYEDRLAMKGGAVDTNEWIMVLELYATSLREIGRRDRGVAVRRQALDEARETGNQIQQGFVLASLAADLVRDGDQRAAGEAAREALCIGSELSHPRITAAAHSILAGLAAVSGDHDAATGHLQEIERQDQGRLSIHDKLAVRFIRGRCALLRDDPAGAQDEAQEGFGIADDSGMREFAWRMQDLLSEAFALAGRAREAQTARVSARAIIREVASEIADALVRRDYENEPRRRAILAEVADPVAHAGRSPSSPDLPPDPAKDAGSAFANDAGVEASGQNQDSLVRMLSTIYEITQIVSSIRDLQPLLDKVMDLAIEIVRAERGLIFLYRSETDEMEMVVGRDLEGQTIEDADAYSRSILREAGAGRAVVARDAVAEARFSKYRSIALYRIRSLMCVPLKIRDRIIGTVYVDTRVPGSRFTADDLKFLEAFANQATIAIENARMYEELHRENRYLREVAVERHRFENIIGRSKPMKKVFSLVQRVATSELPVLIRGESGTGKELVARAIHLNGQRRAKRFYSENCAALPDTLLESELFGHVKGAFTGAAAARKGLFELADGGTLFMDEVGDMSMALQSKLLRVLQEGEIRPVGSETPRRVDVRIISATNRDLETMIREKSFREDLYFRLNVISIPLPPLRDRPEDIPLLIDHFLARVAEKNQAPKLGVDPPLMARLMRHEWPGNVRELENEIQRLALFADGETITLRAVRGDYGLPGRLGPTGTRGVETGVTRRQIERALVGAGGNRDEAARSLGISRRTMFRKMKRFGVARGRPGRPAGRRPS